MTWLFTLPPIISVVIFVMAIILIGLGSYFLGRRFAARTVDGEMTNVATVLFRATGVLLGLMLSMNFATVRTDYAKIQDSVELEASQILDLNQDLKRFGSRETERREGGGWVRISNEPG